MNSFSAIKTNFPTIVSSLISDRKRLVAAIAWLVIGFLILRSCILNARDSLPPELTEQIESHYRVCISPDDTPIWPGETRQPECGSVDLKLIGEGLVPEKQKSEGITRAICYQIKEQNPFWSTQGTTRHEIKWSARTSHQVAILQNGAWKIFPDQAQENEQRWATYSCPIP
ncbi:MAG TPA: hypothetical protein VK249_20055 [Anaerolineales bacterium]|nr:hypothetical protein [Anaerolineales bacterium]